MQYRYRTIVTRLEVGEDNELNELIEGGKIVHIVGTNIIPERIGSFWDEAQKGNTYYRLLVEYAEN